MTFLTLIFTYFVTWWIVLFVTLPWGNRQPDTPEVGMMHGAPANPNIKKKMIWTTFLSFIVVGIIYACVEANIIDFREAAREMDARIYGARTGVE